MSILDYFEKAESPKFESVLVDEISDSEIPENAIDVSPEVSLEELKEMVESQEIVIGKFPTLYKTALTDKVYEWTIYWDFSKMQLFTIHGYLDGKKQKSDVQQLTPLKRKTDLYDIGLVRIKKRFKDQTVSKGYEPVITTHYVIPAGKERCMLAKQFVLNEELDKLRQNQENDKLKSSSSPKPNRLKRILLERKIISDPSEVNGNNYSAWLKKLRNKKLKLDFPVMVQRKLDGVRTLVHREAGTLKYLSRQHRQYHFIAKYMDSELEIFLDCLSKYSNNPELDGEMWCEGYDFNTLTGIIQASKNESQDLKHVRYNVFDYFSQDNLPYEERYENLRLAFKDYRALADKPRKFSLVRAYQVGSYEELKEYHCKFTTEGYEGTIIRKISIDENGDTNAKRKKSALYIHGRTSNLMKITDWFSAEGELLDVESGKGKFANQGIFVLRNPFHDPEDESSVKTFMVVPACTEAERMKYLFEKEKFIGKLYTFEYKALTAYRCPMKARGKGFREYE